MKTDVERELRQVQDLIEGWERNRPPEDTDEDDNPDSSVPAPLKPKPFTRSGAVAIPEPEKDDNWAAGESVRNLPNASASPKSRNC